MRVVFMGTPHFAVPTLRALHANAAPGRVWPHGLELVALITRPDKPVGRGHALVPSPAKAAAVDLGIPVYQPGPLRRPEALALIQGLAPDLIVVTAFGQILPAEVLHLPRHGCLNIHASLLPRHRGAAPIAGAILAGDAETGVSIMLMDVGLDTGPIIASRATPVQPGETTGDLSARLADLGAALLMDVLPDWLAGRIVPRPQDDTQATVTRLLRKEDGRLDWTQPADDVARQVRAYTPWPGAFTTWEGRQLKVLRATSLAEPAGAPAPAPGVVYLDASASGATRLACVCGQGALALEMIQLEGKRALTAAEFVRGYGRIVGARLGL
ncbi:MAG TPA: methionyl-tRNA formyltransferase [Ktedonobacterales bacterium]